VTSPAHDLAAALERDDETLAIRAADAARLPGLRARQAAGCIDAARKALEQARGFLRAPSSGFFPLTRDPRREDEEPAKCPAAK
jgi:hypothetical protein